MWFGGWPAVGGFLDDTRRFVLWLISVRHVLVVLCDFVFVALRLLGVYVGFGPLSGVDDVGGRPRR
jgi:hypothetical protein